MTSLTNFENPFSNPLQEACSGFQVAALGLKMSFRKTPVILKIVAKASYEIKSTNKTTRARKGGTENLMRLLKQLKREINASTILVGGCTQLHNRMVPWSGYKMVPVERLRAVGALNLKAQFHEI
jgi:hypothetical protein